MVIYRVQRNIQIKQGVCINLLSSLCFLPGPDEACSDRLRTAETVSLGPGAECVVWVAESALNLPGISLRRALAGHTWCMETRGCSLGVA